MDKRKFKYIIYFLSVLFFANIIFFILNFKNQRLSDKLEDWANFSNYFSGISNVIISIVTLIVTIFIAFTLSSIEENRNQKNLIYDRKKSLREMREKEYSEISTNLNNVWEYITLSDREKARDQLYICLLYTSRCV